MPAKTSGDESGSSDERGAATTTDALLAIADSSAHSLNNLLSSILLSSWVLHGEHADREDSDLLDNIEQASLQARRVLSELVECVRGLHEESRLPVSRVVEAVAHAARERLPADCQVTTRHESGLSSGRGATPRSFDILLRLVLLTAEGLGGPARIGIDLRSSETASDREDRREIDILVSHPPVDQLLTELEQVRAAEALREEARLAGLDLTPARLSGRPSGWCLTLPAETVDSLREPGERQRPPAGRGQTLLVVDDDALVLESVGNTLRRSGYRVITASNGREAIEVYDRQREEIAALVTDLAMPELGGIATIQRLSRVDDDLRAVVITGVVAQREKLEALSLDSVRAVIAKPIEPVELLDGVARAVA